MIFFNSYAILSINIFIIQKELYPDLHIIFINTKCMLSITIYQSFFLCETATVPSLNPFRNFRLTTERYRWRPVPVVFRLLALTDHPYFRIFAAGYLHEAQVFFWIWKLTRPHLLQMVWVLFRRLPNELVPFVWNAKIVSS